MAAHYYMLTGWFPSALCMLGNFSCFCRCLLTFFKINSLKRFFQEHLRSVKQLGSRSGRHFVHPDLDPNYLQRLYILLTGYSLTLS